MGYSEDVMYDMAMKDLRTMFPEYDGWQGRLLDAGSKSETSEKFFSFSRRYQGKAEHAIVLVSFSAEIRSDISSGFSDIITTKISDSAKKILLIPRAAVVPPLSPEIGIKEMKAFGQE